MERLYLDLSDAGLRALHQCAPAWPVGLPGTVFLAGITLLDSADVVLHALPRVQAAAVFAAVNQWRPRHRDEGKVGIINPLNRSFGFQFGPPSSPSVAAGRGQVTSWRCDRRFKLLSGWQPQAWGWWEEPLRDLGCWWCWESKC